MYRYKENLSQSPHREFIMKQYIQIWCPFLSQRDDLVKNGHRENGTQRYRCKACRKSVQWGISITSRVAAQSKDRS